LHNKLWSKNDKPCNELLHRNSNIDLKMHVYSVPLRSPFAFPRVLLHFNHCNHNNVTLQCIHHTIQYKSLTWTVVSLIWHT